MQKFHRSLQIPKMLLEWVFLVGLMSVIAVLLSRMLFRMTTTQDNSSVAAALQPTSVVTAVLIQEDNPIIPSTAITTQRANLFDSVLVGQEAPNFTLPTLEGDELTLSSLQGQAVWINFWTSWCQPCRIETPFITAAYERYRGDGLVVLGMNVTEQDTLDEVHRFVAEFNVNYPIVLDQPGHVSNDSYNLIGLPMSVFIDRDGSIKRIVIGTVSESEVDMFVDEILGESEPS